ncbi:MAG: DUF4177 domain-containing protein [Paracoccus sp. (in: a-proteobacteria)]|uniref:DUF4177 domain-containing protein n=1 Tax=Paracoccus sp. TaxID=267 RepID=UPI0039E358DE
MSRYEYIAIPAPARGEKTKSAKAGIDRFAATLTDTLNQMADDGWNYVRAETLPAEERSGLTGRSTVYHNLLIFRRALVAEAADHAHLQPAREVAPPLVPEAAPQSVTAPEAQTPPVRAPFSQPMRAMPERAQSRAAEPPLTRPEPQPAGPRLGPASR